MFTIDVISDTVCPWCYVGKRKLERALSKLPELEYSLTWRPFQLNPNMPKDGKNRKAYIQEKFGDGGHFDAMTKSLLSQGPSLGIEFDFAAIERSPNTLNSHRLIKWSHSGGAQDQVVEALFYAYFSEGRDIGDVATLVDIATKCDMDGELVSELLQGQKDADLVSGEAAQASRMGVTGVPTFVFDGKYAVSGAQEPETLVQMIENILAEKQRQ